MCEMMGGEREEESCGMAYGPDRQGRPDKEILCKQFLLYPLGSLPILGHESLRTAVCKLYCIIESLREI